MVDNFVQPQPSGNVARSLPHSQGKRNTTISHLNAAAQNASTRSSKLTLSLAEQEKLLQEAIDFNSAFASETAESDAPTNAKRKPEDDPLASEETYAVALAGSQRTDTSQSTPIHGTPPKHTDSSPAHTARAPPISESMGVDHPMEGGS